MLGKTEVFGENHVQVPFFTTYPTWADPELSSDLLGERLTDFLSHGTAGLN